MRSLLAALGDVWDVGFVLGWAGCGPAHCCLARCRFCVVDVDGFLRHVLVGLECSMLVTLIPKRPRVARPASRLHNSLNTLLQIVVLWSLALGLIPFAIAWCERSMSWPGLQSMPWFGSAVFVAASLIGLVAANVLVRDGHGTPLPLDTAREFVVAGPYRYVRTPMAMSGIIQAVCVGLSLGSPDVIGYAVLGGVLWQYLARPWEEADMAERFGEPYLRYRDEVACWIPRLRPYSGAT